MKQLEFFENPRDIEKEMNDFKKEWEKTRRSLYARQAEIIKKQQELIHDYEIMKMNLCIGFRK